MDKVTKVDGEKARAALRPTRVWHPLLLAVCPVLGIVAHNAGRVPFDSFKRPALVFMASALVFTLILRIVIRDRHRAGIVTSAVFVAFFMLWGVLEDLIRRIVPLMSGLPPAAFYGAYAVLALAAVGYVASHYRKRPRFMAALLVTLVAGAIVWSMVAVFMLSPMFGRRAAWVVTGYLLAFVTVVVYALRYKGDLELVTKSLNWFGGALVALYLALLAFNLSSLSTPVPPPLAEQEAANLPAKDELPDVYVIALEGYARSDVLRKVYGYNNMPFEHAMAEKGFVTARQATTNYADALMSLTACLNMDYLSDLVDAQQAEHGDIRSLLSLYHENRTFGWFDRAEYEMIAFSPGVGLMEPREPFDQCLGPWPGLTELETVLLGRTVLGRVFEVVFFARYGNPAYWRYEPRRSRILHMRDTLGSIAAEPHEHPRFVYVNMVTPGPPFLFTRNGGRAEPFGPGSLAIDRGFRGTPAEFRDAYVGQVHFTNQMLLGMVDDVMENASRPAAFIIFSSEGLGALARNRDEALMEQTAPLVMVRFAQEAGPGAASDDAALYQDISLVNLMRITLNRLLDLKLGLLPDKVVPADPARPLLNGSPMGVAVNAEGGGA